eukprot:scpid83173/ scgid10642/ 
MAYAEYVGYYHLPTAMSVQMHSFSNMTNEAKKDMGTQLEQRATRQCAQRPENSDPVVVYISVLPGTSAVRQLVVSRAPEAAKGSQPLRKRRSSLGSRFSSSVRTEMRTSGASDPRLSTQSSYFSAFPTLLLRRPTSSSALLGSSVRPSSTTRRGYSATMPRKLAVHQQSMELVRVGPDGLCVSMIFTEIFTFVELVTLRGPSAPGGFLLAKCHVFCCKGAEDAALLHRTAQSLISSAVPPSADGDGEAIEQASQLPQPTNRQ